MIMKILVSADFDIHFILTNCSAVILFRGHLSRRVFDHIFSNFEKRKLWRVAVTGVRWKTATTLRWGGGGSCSVLKTAECQNSVNSLEIKWKQNEHNKCFLLPLGIGTPAIIIILIMCYLCVAMPPALGLLSKCWHGLSNMHKHFQCMLSTQRWDRQWRVCRSGDSEELKSNSPSPRPGVKLWSLKLLFTLLASRPLTPIFRLRFHIYLMKSQEKSSFCEYKHAHNSGNIGDEMIFLFFFPFFAPSFWLCFIVQYLLPFEGVESKTLKGIITWMIFALGWSVVFAILLFR